MAQDNIEQIPLPDPDNLPAWVHAALDRYDTSNATYIGLAALRSQYRELTKPHILERIENMAFSHLRYIATRWQFANFRTYVTTFEMEILSAEIEALRYPYAMKRYTQQTVCYDSNGDPYTIDEEVYRHDVNWIAGYIQKRLGSYGKILGTQQIKHILQKIGTIYEVCEALDIEVAIYESKPQGLQRTLRKVA